MEPSDRFRSTASRRQPDFNSEPESTGGLASMRLLRSSAEQSAGSDLSRGENRSARPREWKRIPSFFASAHPARGLVVDAGFQRARSG